MIKRDKIIIGIVAAQFLGLAAFLTAIKSHSASSDKPAKKITFPAKLIIGMKDDIRGKSDANYTLVEFGDYECPPCQRSHPKVLSLLKKHSSVLRFQFRQFPLEEIHPLAMPAAIAAESARIHGTFWNVHDALYTRTEGLKEKAIPATATQDVSIAQRVVQQDIADATKIGVTGTPTFVLCCPDGQNFRLENIEQVENYLR